MRALLVTLLVLVAAPVAAEPPVADAPSAQAPASDLPPRGRVEGVALDPADLPISDLDEGRGTRRPSGFWTGYRPARGGAYRWPLVFLAIGIIAVTVAAVVYLLRRARRSGSSAGSSTARS